MIINLSDVLSANDKTVEKTAVIDMNKFHSKVGVFPITYKEPVYLVITHVKDRQLLIKGHTNLEIAIPCDRCLKDVTKKFVIEFYNEVDLHESEVDNKELEEKNYIDGYNLDVDKLLYNEILIGWPMKILCCKDCKGICNVCGQNLNEGTCECEDASLDPRMSVIRDVFKNFKEV
ncbi:YceD family protein [Lachnospiraceae bacterium LCP25S3_G4]